MRNKNRHRIVKYICVFLAVLVLCFFCAGIIYAIVEEDNNENSEISNECDITYPEILGGDILDYFNHASNDGINVTFYHGANSISEMEVALQDAQIDMLEADITLRGYGTANQTEEPIMAHPPLTNSDNTLSNWFTQIIKTNKGLKMDMKVEEVIPYALQELRSHGNELKQPVWINADVVHGPNTVSTPINGSYFTDNVNLYFPNVTLSMGWTTGYRFVSDNEQYSWNSMDEMLALTSKTFQRISFPIRAALAKESWYKFLWLVEQEERFSLTVWSADTDPVSLEDKLFLRDNYNPSKMFYDTGPYFTEDLKTELRNRTLPKQFYSGGNSLDFFNILDRDAMKITWAHRVNDEQYLERVIQDDKILMLEADVRVKQGVPIMAHDPVDVATGNFTLKNWLMRVSNTSNKGLKLDFKTTEVLEPAFIELRNMQKSLNMPVWLNSDILPGPNSVTTPVDGNYFLHKVEELFPHATLSLGWTTFYKLFGNNEGYNQEMVSEMYNLCSGLRQAITFPVRASLTRQSLKELKWLVSKSNRYSLTVWHSGTEKVGTEDLLEIHKNFESDQVYYDLPEDMMDDFLNSLANQ